MNLLPTAKTKAAQVLVSLKDTLATFVSPGIDPDQYLASAIAEVNMLRMQFSDEQLSDPRTIESIVKSVFNGAVVGLLLGPALGHAYLVGYTRHRGQKGEYVEVQFMPGYKGMLDLAFANDFLVQCDPEFVLNGEEIDRGHTEQGPYVKHRIPIPRDKPTRENIIGVYCTYATKAGGKGVVYVERDELKQIDTGRNVWKTNYPAMSLKTAVRRAAKRWRLTRQMAYAVALDEQAEREEPQTSLVPQPDQAENGINLDDLPESGE